MAAGPLASGPICEVKSAVMSRTFEGRTTHDCVNRGCVHSAVAPTARQALQCIPADTAELYAAAEQHGPVGARRRETALHCTALTARAAAAVPPGLASWPHRSGGCLLAAEPLPALIAQRLRLWLSRCKCSSALPHAA